MSGGGEPAPVPPSGGPDWSSLMAESQNGDRDAYRLLLHNIAGYLRSIIVQQRFDRLDVEDAVQDILITVDALRHTFDPGRPFVPWLAAIAHRRIGAALRRVSQETADEQRRGPDSAVTLEQLAFVGDNWSPNAPEATTKWAAQRRLIFAAARRRRA